MKQLNYIFLFSILGGYEINGVPVEKVDLTTSNGVFHQMGGLL